jgi:hypothetical protein
MSYFRDLRSKATTTGVVTCMAPRWDRDTLKREPRELQGGRCAICDFPERVTAPLALDHGHGCPECADDGTGCPACVRGLLCNQCNLTLGHFADDPNRFERARDYLLERRPTFAGMEP